MSSASSSPSSSYHDDSSDIDELDYRVKKLNRLLRKNVKEAGRRKNLIDVVRDKAWLLEDQVELLETQTKNVKQALRKKSFRRRLVMFGAFVSSVILVGFGVNHLIHTSDDGRH